MRTDFGPDSDVDVLVEFRPDTLLSLFEIVDLRDELPEVIQGADVVTSAAIVNPHRRKTMKPELEPVYTAG